MATMQEILGNAGKMDMMRVTKNQRVPNRGKKKHGSQMTKKERDYLYKRLQSFEKWTVSRHALDRIKMKNIRVTYDDIVSTIYYSEIIEYHVVENFKGVRDERVLLRGKAIVNRNKNANFVYSITRGEIVSAWLNRVDDRHATLSWSDYSKDVKILP